VRQTNLGKNLRHGRMSDFTDTLTVAFVIILLFGSIVIYLYTCIQQNSQKVSLLESILLDLKLSTEIQSYTELPAEVPADVKEEPYTPFEEESAAVTCDTHVEPSLEEYSSAIDHAINEVKEDTITDVIQPIELNEISDVIEAVHYDTTTVSYDAMTLKELHALGKTRGIAGSSTMKKAAIIDALKADDATQTQATGSNSFLETSSPFSNDA